MINEIYGCEFIFFFVYPKSGPLRLLNKDRRPNKGTLARRLPRRINSSVSSKLSLLDSSSDTDNNERPINGARRRRARFGRFASLSGLTIGETKD